VILHIANLDKFIPPFIKFVNENFDGKEHLFCVLGNNKKYPIPQQNNLKISKPTLIGALKHYARVFRDIQCAEKVILHGLFDVRLIILLSLMPWVLKKCYWVIWGGDLYSYQKPKLRKRDKVKEMLRTFAIKRMGYLVTYIPGDVALAREWYGAKGQYKECIMYVSNIMDEKFIANEFERKEPANEAINIIVGNSADPSNNHIETLTKLADYKEADIRLFVPLSYGDKKHAEKVTSYGRQEFGEKFEPLTNFIPLNEYLNILRTTDIAIFNHKRQQAMGNTITLLGMGKTVYMRPDFTHTQFLSYLGITFYDVANFKLEKLDDEVATRNQHIIYKYFSKENLVKQLKYIFE
jgi:hypothetical protein